LMIAECGMQIDFSNPQSAFRNPKSKDDCGLQNAD